MKNIVTPCGLPCHPQKEKILNVTWHGQGIFLNVFFFEFSVIKHLAKVSQKIAGLVKFTLK
jgi:hypothetical protein